MKKILLILVCIAAQISFIPVQAEEEEEVFLTAGELLAGCDEGAAPGAPNQYCMQFLFGLVQNVIFLQQADPNQLQVFCIDPQKISLPEVTDQMTAYLRTQEGRLHQEAYKLAIESLAKNYPCQASVF